MNTLHNNQIKSITGSGMVCGKLHDVVITEFLDKYFIIISDNGKIGTLVQILFEMNQMKTASSLNSKVLFGRDEPEIHAVAQSIVETLNIKRPIIFGFSVKEYDATTAVNMRQIISELLKDERKENLTNLNYVSS